MDPPPPDPSPKASGSKPLPQQQQLRESSSARQTQSAHDSVQSQPTMPEDESKGATGPSGPQQTKSGLWHRLGFDMTLGSVELDILVVSTCLKLLLFPA